jgi:hypothetical protein
MYQEHHTFTVNKALDKPIWKYLDFWKFLNLLDTKSLYFSNAIGFGDNHEGRIPIVVQEMMLENDVKKGVTHGRDNINFVERVTRKLTFISSWTYNNKESFALWKMYAKDKTGIAIKTNLQNLKSSFSKTEKEIYIGEINYFDKNNFNYDTSNLFYPSLVKLDYYSYENEIRCITSISPEERKDDNDNGRLIEVNLEELIKTIYISPNSKPEFKKMIELLKKEYNLNFTIEFSEVNDSWL